MNQIPLIQNSEKQLERLAAQRELYSSAKNYYSFEVIGSIIIPLVLTSASILLANISLYSALYGICFYLFDSLIIEPAITERKTKAAKIQELFDCEVLEISKSPFKTIADVTVEEILERYDAHKKIESNVEKIRDWYPQEVSGVGVPAARLICQRMNFGWDSRLRKSFNNIVKITTVILPMLVIAGITLGKIPGENLPLILSGILPLFRFCLKLYQDNKSTTDRLAKLNTYFETSWTKMIAGELSGSELNEVSRRIQDEIYDNRIKSPLIPDIFYDSYRNKDESLMTRTTRNLITSHKESRDEREK